MGLFDSLFKKEKQILRQEDLEKLQELERAAFMKEAELLVAESGKKKAQLKFGIKKDIYA